MILANASISQKVWGLNNKDEDELLTQWWTGIYPVETLVLSKWWNRWTNKTQQWQHQRFGEKHALHLSTKRVGKTKLKRMLHSSTYVERFDFGTDYQMLKVGLGEMLKICQFYGWFPRDILY